MAGADRLEELRDRLYTDTVFWAENCAKIVNKRGDLVPIVPNAAQLKFDAALEKQRAAGVPMRAITLKARQVGYSTWTELKIMHRITQRPYRRALVVAHNKPAASSLFTISDRIYVNLPGDRELGIKPNRSNLRRGSYMRFGQGARSLIDEGAVGLDSSLEVDTAQEVEAGRGFTYTELHASEAAMWPHAEKKTALYSAVPDEPETLIVEESTAKGSNHFRNAWDRAVAGESGFVPIFTGWWEEAGYTLPFDSEEDRAEFVEGIGEGPWGEDEPRYVEEFGCTPEQLNWRRRQIVAKMQSNLELFKQEMPASPEEAFISSGKHVFSMSLVSRVIDRVKQTDPPTFSPDNPGPALGELKPAGWANHKGKTGMIAVPTGAIWTPVKRRERPQGDFWRVWKSPETGDKDAGKQPGRYVIGVDPASGEETDSGENAWHACQVVDHRSKEQVAEYRSREDADLFAIQVYLAALHYNRAVLAVEKTGGYGLSMIRKINRDFRYPLMYRQKVLDKAKDTQSADRVGWDTNRSTKPLLEDGIREILREIPEVFNSWLLANELSTYVKDAKGKTGPEPDAFSDLLMAFAIAQQVAQEWPIPSGKKPAATTSTRSVRDPVTGY